jgi:membrane-bound PQQ-dependent dehydrogenase (glucose/quinate/shikimate family)
MMSRLLAPTGALIPYNRVAAVLSLGALAGGPTLHAAAADWLHFGNDPGGARHSQLAQITPGNVRQLERIWQFKLPPTGNPNGKQMVAFEVTPLKVESGLYFCGPDNVVFSLDAETGKQNWSFDPKVRKWSGFRVCRGVSHYSAVAEGGDCPNRIISATNDARLFALDRQRGQPCASFGEAGFVNLLEGMGSIRQGGYSQSSAPTVVGDTIVLGGAVSDTGRSDNASGVIRAFSAVTGELLWAWDMDRPGERSLPANGEQYTNNTPNAWAPLSADPELGLVFIPTGNSNPDYYGAHRSPAAEKYSTSIVALDVRTGDVRWSFQMVHHDIWDYDAASQPVLTDFPTPAGTVPAVIAVTKRGETFVLDRSTGKPLTKVVEMAVPQGVAQGDQTAKTQPFSVEMPSFAGPDVTEQSMWGLTPLDQLWCRIQFRKARYDGIFTPPTEGKPWLYSPGWMGGMDWGGASVDPKRQIMVTTTMHIANYDRFVSHEEARRDPEIAETMTVQEGSPYAGIVADYFHSPLGVPCQAPPYGRLNAIDLNTREVLWSIPFGTAEHTGPLELPWLRVPFAIPMGNVTMGGNLLTESGLAFIGGSLDQQFRAIDTKTGEELWSAPLEAPGFATPMTYVSPSGRQVVAIAVGGFSKYGPNNGLFIEAYALPR